MKLSYRNLLAPLFTVLFSLGIASAATAPMAVPANYMPRPTRTDVHPLTPGRDVFPKVYNEATTAAIMDILNKVYYGKAFPFAAKDGSIFYNRTNQIPSPVRPDGYWREYTLLTPGRPSTPYQLRIGDNTYTVSQMLGQRGPERIIIGGFNTQVPVIPAVNKPITEIANNGPYTPGEFIYYTPDHYVTFIRLQIVR